MEIEVELSDKIKKSDKFTAYFTTHSNNMTARSEPFALNATGKNMQKIYIL